MKLVLLPSDTVRPLPFYLAEEEWLARNGSPGDEFFFVWQVEPTVIIGRNQVAATEIDIDFCRQEGINMVRRKSGGGAVLADMNNLMLSYITIGANETVATTFSAYTGMVADALRQLGLDASATSRNDVLIGGAKVSGNSYYHTGRADIVHGTMLYDCDRALMSRVLRPSAAKLRSHGVESVRSRVTTIREHLPHLSIDAFKDALMQAILAGGVETLTLTDDDVAEIAEMSREYSDPARLTGLDPRADLEAEARIEGVGSLRLSIGLRHDTITSLRLTGDYLETADASALLDAALRGTPFTREALEAALAKVDAGSIIPGLSARSLADIIFQHR